MKKVNNLTICLPLEENNIASSAAFDNSQIHIHLHEKWLVYMYLKHNRLADIIETCFDTQEQAGEFIAGKIKESEADYEKMMENHTERLLAFVMDETDEDTEPAPPVWYKYKYVPVRCLVTLRKDQLNLYHTILYELDNPAEKKPDEIDWNALRTKYFAECTINDSVDGQKVRIDYAPHDFFEWFKRNLKTPHDRNP